MPKSASATTLLNGTVLIAGGSYAEGVTQTNPDGTTSLTGPDELASMEIFDPVAGTVTASSASMSTPRSGHQAFLLPNNNNVLLVGGSYNSQALASADLYTPWTAQFNPPSIMSSARTGATGSAMNTPASSYPATGIDGMLLVAGGSNQQSSELYGFATVKTDKTDYAPGTTVTITGSGWQPGETVTLSFTESPNLDTPGPYTAVADASGTITDTEFAPDTLDLNVRFYLTAVGSASNLQAQNTFTDSNSVPAPTNVTTQDQSIGQILLTWTNHTGSGGGANTEIDRKFLPPGSGPCPAESPNFPVPNNGYLQNTLVPVSGNGLQDSYLDSIPAANQIVGKIVCYQLYVVKQQSGQTSRVGDLASATAVVDHPPVAVNDNYTVNANGTLTVSAPGVLSNDTDVDAGQTLTAVQLGSDSSPSHGSLTLNANGSFMYTPTAGYTGTDTFTYHAYDGYAYSDNAATVTITVSQLGTTTSVNAPAITYGQDGSVTVAVSSSSGTPTGNVSLAINGGTAVSKTLTSGSATFTKTDIATLGAPSVASYSLAASYTAQNGFGASSNAGTLTVNPVALTITASSPTINYGDAVPAITASYSGFVNNDTSASLSAQPTCSVQGTPLNAGKYTTSCSGAVDNNYTLGYQTGTLTIAQVGSTVTVSCPTSVTYNGAAQTPCTATATGAGGLNQLLTVNYSNNTNAGTATASASYVATTNYAASSNSVNFTINRAPVTATAGSYNGTYDGLPHQTSPLCAVMANAPNTYTGNLSCTNSTASVGPDVTSGTVTPIVSGANQSNFDITLHNGAYSIAPAPLTITADNQTMVFGGSTPTFTANSGVLSSSTSAGVTGLTFTVYTDNTPQTAVMDFQSLKAGSYPIVASSASALDYSIQYGQPATLQVTKAALTGSVTITPVDPNTVAYGGTVTANVYLNSYSIGGVPVMQSQPDPANPGSQLPPSLTVYLVPVVNGVIGGPNQAVKFGTSTAVPTYDNSPSTTGTNKTGWTTIITGKAPTPGNYVAVVYGDDPGDKSLTNLQLADAGYFYPDTADISYPTLQSNQLDVVQAALTITANSPIKTYGDTVTFAGTEFTTSGLLPGDSVSSVTLASAGAAATANAGSYDVTPSAAVGSGLGNYAITYKPGTLTVNPATPTVNVTWTGGPYNGSPYAATGSVTGVNSVNLGTPTFTYYSGSSVATGTSLGSVAPTNAGTYTVRASYAGNTNYTSAYKDATITITQAQVTATAGGYSAPYDGSAHSPSACQVTGTYTGDLVCANSPTSVGPGVSSGPVTPNVSSPTLSSAAISNNFAITSMNGSYSITQATPKVNLTWTGGPYNGSQYAATGSVTGVGSPAENLGTPTFTYYSGSTASGTPLGGAPTNAGIYTVRASYAGNTNYTSAYKDATITITQAQVTATAGGYSAPYDGSAHSPSACQVTGTYTGDLVCANSPTSVGPGVSSGMVTPNVSSPTLSSAAISNNFAITPMNGSYSITQATPTVNLTWTGGPYNGSPYAATGSVTGVNSVNLGTPTFTYYSGSSVATGTSLGSVAPTNAGTYTVRASYAGSTNYTSAYKDATITISQAPVTATAGSYSGTFDGSAHSPSACAVTGTYTVGLSCTNFPASVGPGVSSGTITPVLSGTGLSNFAINSVNGNYSITAAPATATITVTTSKGNDTAGNPYTQYSDPATFKVSVSPASLGGIAPLNTLISGCTDSGGINRPCVKVKVGTGSTAQLFGPILLTLNAAGTALGVCRG